MNRIIGQKVSITTHKPQTTRNRILGIKTEASHQMIFVDTPGIHDSSVLLNKRIVDYAINTLKESDVNLFLIEPLPSHTDKLHPGDAAVLEKLKANPSKTLLVINKTDQASNADVLRTIEMFSENQLFQEIIPVSALKERNLDRLLEVVRSYLPESPFYFEDDQITDVSERFLVAEFLREEVFKQLQQELPYCIAAEVETMEETESIINIHAVIYVERDSQKGMVIGRKGERLKQIGQRARLKIEKLLGNKVFLSLHVRVLKKWSQSARYLNQLGFEE